MTGDSPSVRTLQSESEKRHKCTDLRMAVQHKVLNLGLSSTDQIGLELPF